MSLDQVTEEIQRIVKTVEKDKQFLALAELKEKYPDVPEDIFKTVFLEMQKKETPPFALELSQFMEGPKEINWIVEDLIPADTLSVLASKPKLGKTLLTFNLAIALAKDGDFLRRQAKKINTLIIQLEDPPLLIRNRLDKMGAYGLGGIFIRAGLPMTETDWEGLPQFIRENNIGLCIIDPLVFAMYGDENDATKVSAFLKKLRNLIFGTGCSILLVHHHRKTPGEYGDQIRGSSAILGAVDVALELIRENEQTPTATLKVTSRFAGLEDEIIKLDVDTLTWQSEGNADGYKQRKREEAILEALEDGEAGIKDLGETLGLSKPAFFNDLKRLVAKGYVNEESKESGKKGGRPGFIYSIASEFSNFNRNQGLLNSTHPEQAKQPKNEFSNLNDTLGPKKSYKTPVDSFECSNCGRKAGSKEDPLFSNPAGGGDVCLKCWRSLSEA